MQKFLTLRVSPPAHPGTTPRHVEVIRKCGSKEGDLRTVRRREEEKEAGWMDEGVGRGMMRGNALDQLRPEGWWD